MDINKLNTILLSRLEECKEFLAELAVNKSSGLKGVLNIPFGNLPLYINETNENRREMILARLRREDIKKNPSFVCQSLYDVEFDMDEYKNIGWNDGSLSTLRNIFEALGDEEHEKECSLWIYSE